MPLPQALARWIAVSNTGALKTLARKMQDMSANDKKAQRDERDREGLLCFSEAQAYNFK